MTLAAAPEIIAKLNIPAKAAVITAPPTQLLFSQLHMITPAYYKSMVEKYGNDDFVSIMDRISQSLPPIEQLH